MIFLCEGKVGPTVREAEYLWTTVAYILWPAGARKLLAELPGAELAVSVLRSKRGYSGSILCFFFPFTACFTLPHAWSIVGINTDSNLSCNRAVCTPANNKHSRASVNSSKT